MTASGAALADASWAQSDTLRFGTRAAAGWPPGRAIGSLLISRKLPNSSAAAGLSFGGGAHLVRRSAALQRSSIRRTLRGHAEKFRAHAQARALDWQYFPRAAVVERVCGILASPPVGPLVLTGPQGAGTSAITEASLARSQPPLLLMLNLRERAATADRTLFWHLVRASGYYVMLREWADIGFLRNAAHNVDAYDIEHCFQYVGDVFREERLLREQQERDSRAPSRWRSLSGGGNL